MAEFQLTLTDEERVFLVNFLEEARKEVLVEEHRTRTPSYREVVQRQEDFIVRLLGKLKQSPK